MFMTGLTDANRPVTARIQENRMSRDTSRRDVLRQAGVLAGATMLGGKTATRPLGGAPARASDSATITVKQAGDAVWDGLGNATVTLPSASTAGTTLVAVVADQGTPFTAPDGWTKIRSSGSSKTDPASGHKKVPVRVGARFPSQVTGYQSPYPFPTAASISADYTWATGYLGSLNCTKLFYPGTLPQFFGNTLADNLEAGVLPVICYNTPDTNVTTYCQGVTKPVILVYDQEPEGKGSAGATFVSEFKRQSDMIRGAGNPLVKVAVDSGGYLYGLTGSGTPRDADVYAGNFLTGLGSVSASSGQPYADMFLIDCYPDADNSDLLSTWPAFQRWLALVTDTSIVGVERPKGLGEYGRGAQDGSATRLSRFQSDMSYLTDTSSGGFLGQQAFPVQFFSYWWADNSMSSPTDLVWETQFLDSATKTWFSGLTAAFGGNVEIWYYPDNPGGISSAAFTISPAADGLSTGIELARGAMLELDAGGAAVTVDAIGGAISAGAGTTSVTVTGNAAVPAGDFLIAGFADDFEGPSPSGDSWGAPAGFTRDRSLHSDSLSLWIGHDADAGAGTPSVTQAESGTSGDGMTGVLTAFGAG
jgi:hypothetical protein